MTQFTSQSHLQAFPGLHFPAGDSDGAGSWDPSSLAARVRIAAPIEQRLQEFYGETLRPQSSSLTPSLPGPSSIKDTEYRGLSYQDRGLLHLARELSLIPLEQRVSAGTLMRAGGFEGIKESMLNSINSGKCTIEIFNSAAARAVENNRAESIFFLMRATGLSSSIQGALINLSMALSLGQCNAFVEEARRAYTESKPAAPTERVARDPERTQQLTDLLIGAGFTNASSPAAQALLRQLAVVLVKDSTPGQGSPSNAQPSAQEDPRMLVFFHPSLRTHFERLCEHLSAVKETFEFPKDAGDQLSATTTDDEIAALVDDWEFEQVSKIVRTILVDMIFERQEFLLPDTFINRCKSKGLQVRD